MSEMEAAIAMDNDATLLLVLFFICIHFFPVSEKEEWKVMRTKQSALQQEKCARHEQAQHHCTSAQATCSRKSTMCRHDAFLY